MRIGYPCINLTIGCKNNRTFRLKSYSEERLIRTVRNNLDCLLAILRFNVEHNILFFRITSDLIPFASHPVCDFNWLTYFKRDLMEIGSYIISRKIRISMHPAQYTVLNSPDSRVLEASIKELEYHAQLLDAMRLDQSARIQLHIGGMYGDKKKSIERFIRTYHSLDSNIKERLVIENDDRQYSVRDCLQVHDEIGIPILLDSLHHELNSNVETLKDVFELVVPTWGQEDGLPMVDYSTSRANSQGKRHAESIDLENFRRFIDQTRPFDYDIMLEIKDKEHSALKAVEIVKSDYRFNKPPE